MLQHISDHNGSIIRSFIQCLAKITVIVLLCSLTWTYSVLWQHICPLVRVCTALSGDYRLSRICE
jgi:hypothetical protein